MQIEIKDGYTLLVFSSYADKVAFINTLNALPHILEYHVEKAEVKQSAPEQEQA